MATVGPSSILYCPHCGNTSVQSLLLSEEYGQTLYEMQSGSAAKQTAVYHVTKCETCRELLLYSWCALFDSGNDGPYGSLVYPKQLGFSDAIPERVRKVYVEAAKVRNASPMAFAVLARRVLEEIVRDKNIRSRNLAAGLAKLVEGGYVPPVLAEATDLIRLIGNAGAHAGDMDVSEHQAWTIDDFLKAILEYVYIAPFRIAELKDRLASA